MGRFARVLRNQVCPLLAVGVVISCAGIVGITEPELDPESRGGQGNASGGGASANAGAGGEDGEETPAALCARYCAAVMTNCRNEFRVYESLAVCTGVCEQLPVGERGETTGNSVRCRLFHANQVNLIGEESLECPAAGPGGNGICGSNCESFCHLEQQLCPDALTEDCDTLCPKLTDLQTFNSSIQTGSTLQCRLYHVTAATQNAALHCPHTAGQGSPPPCPP